MMTRRSLLGGAACVLTAGAVGLSWRARDAAAAEPAADSFPLTRTDAEWRGLLDDEQYAVLRQAATERPFTSALLDEHRRGDFVCAGCDQPLFESSTKFESGTGWPSFWTPIEGAVVTKADRTLGMIRTEVLCGNCGGHLGHVFDDGPPPTGLRYCINGLAMTFAPLPAA